MVEASAIGIDFGDTSSRVAIFRQGGNVEIIPDEFGNLSSPNYVTFKDLCELGEEAQRNVYSELTNTIFGMIIFH